MRDPDGQSLITRLDALFRKRATDAGATSCSADTLLPRRFLARVEHFESFPGVAVPAAGEAFHPPATCYRLFRELEGVMLDGATEYTLVGRCRRRETRTGPTRLPEFTMREIVFIGSRSDVTQRRADLIESVRLLAGTMGLDVEVNEALDPFFGVAPVDRGKRLLQKLLGLKFELTAEMDGSREAISSFNLHHDFFTSRLAIGINGLETAASGCVAHGLERWAEALKTRWGHSEQAWPPAVRAALAQGDA